MSLFWALVCLAVVVIGFSIAWSKIADRHPGRQNVKEEDWP